MVIVVWIEKVQADSKGEKSNGVCLQGKLIAGINSRVQLYDWQLQKDSSRGLVAGAGQSGLVLALYLACRGDFIVVGKLHNHLVLGLPIQPGQPPNQSAAPNNMLFSCIFARVALHLFVIGVDLPCFSTISLRWRMYS